MSLPTLAKGLAAATAFALAIAGGCAWIARGAQKATFEARYPVEVAAVDTDQGFARALLFEDVSTRESPRPGSRFVLSISQPADPLFPDGSQSSVLLDARSRCGYQLTYAHASNPYSKPELAKALPGAPNGSPADLLDAREPKFKLAASSEACARLALRPDLAAAREAVSPADPVLALNKAFAEALPQIKEAIAHGQAVDPGSRFALAGSESTSSSPTRAHTLLERSSGCVWTVREGARPTQGSGAVGPLSDWSVSPASCARLPTPAIAPGLPAPRPEAALPAPAASKTATAATASPPRPADVLGPMGLAPPR